MGARELPTLKYCSDSKLYESKVVALGKLSVNLEFGTSRLTGSRVIDRRFSKVPRLTQPKTEL